MASIRINGVDYSTDGSAVKDFASGGFRSNLFPALNDLSTMLAASILGSNSAATSASGNTIETGLKNFTIGTGKNFKAGYPITVVDQADHTNWMFGFCTVYTSGILSVYVSQTGGSGTLNSWYIGFGGLPLDRKVDIKTTGGTWYKPPCDFVMVELLGGGGGGAAHSAFDPTNQQGAGGGGGGDYNRRIFAASMLDNDCIYTVGAGSTGTGSSSEFVWTTGKSFKAYGGANGGASTSASHTWGAAGGGGGGAFAAGTIGTGSSTGAGAGGAGWTNHDYNGTLSNWNKLIASAGIDSAGANARTTNGGASGAYRSNTHGYAGGNALWGGAGGGGGCGDGSTLNGGAGGESLFGGHGGGGSGNNSGGAGGSNGFNPVVGTGGNGATSGNSGGTGGIACGGGGDKANGGAANAGGAGRVIITTW